MPIYEFVCRECGSEFEQLMSFSAHGHPPCPSCASQHVSRKIGRPAIHFKGSGWYVTDSKGSKQSANGTGESSVVEGESKPPEKAGEGQPAAASEGAGSETKAESKPAESKPGVAKAESAAAA